MLVAIEEAADRLEVPPEAQRKRLEISGNNIDTYWMNTCGWDVQNQCSGKGMDPFAPAAAARKRRRRSASIGSTATRSPLAASFFHAEDRPNSFETKDGNGVAVLTYRRKDQGAHDSRRRRRATEAGRELAGCERNRGRADRPGRTSQEVWCFADETLTVVNRGRKAGSGFYFVDTIPSRKTAPSARRGYCLCHIYKLEGNTLTICTDVRRQGTADRIHGDSRLRPKSDGIEAEAILRRKREAGTGPKMNPVPPSVGGRN